LDVERLDNLLGHGVGLGDLKQVKGEELELGFELRSLGQGAAVLSLHKLGLLELVALFQLPGEAESLIARQGQEHGQTNPKWVAPGLLL
jgi:hypothetical protein